MVAATGVGVADTAVAVGAELVPPVEPQPASNAAAALAARQRSDSAAVRRAALPMTPVNTTRCIVLPMARTNIDIDDRLITEVMRRYRVTTKRQAVDLALRRLVGAPLSRAEALSLEGSGWEGDLVAMRRTDLPAS